MQYLHLCTQMERMHQGIEELQTILNHNVCELDPVPSGYRHLCDKTELMRQQMEQLQTIINVCELEGY